MYTLLYPLSTPLQSFKHQGRHLDVYETIVLKEAIADLFAGTSRQPVSATTPAPALDVCRPAGYVR